MTFYAVEVCERELNHFADLLGATMTNCHYLNNTHSEMQRTMQIVL